MASIGGIIHFQRKQIVSFFRCKKVRLSHASFWNHLHTFYTLFSLSTWKLPLEIFTLNQDQNTLSWNIEHGCKFRCFLFWNTAKKTQIYGAKIKFPLHQVIADIWPPRGRWPNENINHDVKNYVNELSGSLVQQLNYTV